MDLDSLRSRWLADLAGVASDDARARTAFADLAGRYSAPGRHYHTLDHIAFVRARVDTLGVSPRDPVALYSAVWFHDAVYDTRRADNEERSADLAREILAGLGVPATVTDIAAQLIQLTKTHAASEADTDALLLLDADLAILGSDPAGYDDYAAAIRREYAWVAEADYRAGRTHVLRSFLARPTLYHTPGGLLLEARARLNLTREAATLCAAPPV